MTRQEFQIVADVYRLLATYDARAFVAATKHHGLAENLRSALSALAAEAAGPHQEAKSCARPKQGVTVVARKTRVDLRPGLSPETYRQNLITFLTNAKRFPDKQALVSFAKRISVSVAPDARTSRQRVAGQIARRISEDTALRESLNVILSKPGDDQTEGWLNLILNNK